MQQLKHIIFQNLLNEPRKFKDVATKQGRLIQTQQFTSRPTKDIGAYVYMHIEIYHRRERHIPPPPWRRCTLQKLRC